MEVTVPESAAVPVTQNSRRVSDSEEDVVSNVLHLAASQYLRRLILGLRLAFGVTASLCLR
jgi:hypothetical protein